MLSKIWDLIEIVALVVAAVAIGALASPWWGVLAGCVEAVVYVNLLDDNDPPAGDGA